MIPLIIILTALLALAVGFLIGRDWKRLDKTETYEDGYLDGYQDGLRSQEQRREW